MMPILDFYNQVLTALRYRVDDKGLISIITPTGTATPATVNGKRLVLPTKQFMRDGFGEDYQPFHPLSESIARRGTSPVLQHMQRTAKAQFALAFEYLATSLLRVAADRSLHKDLPPDCAEYLKKLSNVNDKTVEVFDQLLKAATKKNKVITVYLKNGGKLNGKAVNRMAVIRFPIIEALDGEGDVLGLDIAKKHRQAISALLRMIVPFGDSPEEYSAGSTNRTAPYLHAFLQAYRKLAVQFNRIIERYARPLELALPVFELYSEKSLEDFAGLYEQMSPLAGNDGDADETDEEGIAAPAVKAPTAQAEAAPRQGSPAPRTLEAKEEGKAFNLNEFLQRFTGQAAVPQQQPMMQQPMQGYNMQPQYQQPMQMGYGMQQPVNPLAQLNTIINGAPQYQQPMQQVNPYAQAVIAHHQQQQPQPMQGYGMAPQAGYGQPGVSSLL